MKVVYMGTPEFAVPALEALIESKEQEVVLVVTQPDRVKGRGKKLLPPPVKEVALREGIEALQPEVVKGNLEFLNRLTAINPDVIVVAAYGRILPKEILELPKYGCINIHASLLPKYRGAAPMQHAILSGEKEAGVTIMKMAEGLDTGDMLLKGSVEIDGMYYPELSEKLSKLGGELILKALDELEKGTLMGEAQDDNLSTYAGMIKKEDGKIDFASLTGEEIERMIRAYEPWPGAYTHLPDGTILKFKAGHLQWGTVPPENLQPGTVLDVKNDGIYIKAKDSIFVLTELQPQGKNRMDVGSYLRGNKIEIGSVLVSVLEEN